MSYQGSLALNMGRAYGRAEEPEERPELEVVNGGGLDARAREGVSPRFVGLVRAVAAALALFLVLGVARVAITTATVTLLQDNSAMQTKITQIESANDGLRVERSSLSSASRIKGIATGAYGMVSATDTEQLTLDPTTSGD